MKICLRKVLSQNLVTRKDWTFFGLCESMLDQIWNCLILEFLCLFGILNKLCMFWSSCIINLHNYLSKYKIPSFGELINLSLLLAKVYLFNRIIGSLWEKAEFKLFKFFYHNIGHISRLVVEKLSQWIFMNTMKIGFSHSKNFLTCFHYSLYSQWVSKSIK